MDATPRFIRNFEEISSEQNGGKILFATDDFFAVAENLLNREEPVWNEEYTEFGKWMDGWETRRKRIAGHDWTIIRLGKPSFVRGLCLDTAFFTGNFAPRFSLQAVCLLHEPGEIQSRKGKMGTAASAEDFARVAKLQSERWKTLIPMSQLRSGSAATRRHYFELDAGDQVLTHVRLNIYPDGGVARLRLFGKSVASAPSNRMAKCIGDEPLRGKCVDFSNAHYGHPDNLVKPWPSKGMHDGWETARRLDRPPLVRVDNHGLMQLDGEEWSTIRLEKTVYVNYIEVDTTHFKGNCPDNVKIQGAFVESDQNFDNVIWDTLIRRTKLKPDQSNGIENSFVQTKKPINHVKIIIAPDGGLARVRIYEVDCEG